MLFSNGEVIYVVCDVVRCEKYWPSFD